MVVPDGGESAERYEAYLIESARAPHADLAAVLRRPAVCHRSSDLQEAFAGRVAKWVRGCGEPPRFMAGVAEACGAKSAVLVLVDARNKQLAVADSGELARAAQDLEFVLGEGPSRDGATRHGPVGATGDAIVARWPCYGPAVIALSVRKVAAAPLDTGASARSRCSTRGRPRAWSRRMSAAVSMTRWH
ncbi:hypothetical protein [Streptomyces sp. NPDC017940]|uniref:hypothetical protein n=1 Tax=Streptomyces sp. NPDC017940 TaxID=3365017 RepID=UPI0037A547E7